MIAHPMLRILAKTKLVVDCGRRAPHALVEGRQQRRGSSTQQPCRALCLQEVLARLGLRAERQHMRLAEFGARDLRTQRDNDNVIVIVITRNPTLVL